MDQPIYQQEYQPPPQQDGNSEPSATESVGRLQGLREQIKSNAEALFPYAAKDVLPQYAFEVVILSDPMGAPTRRYQALVTYNGHVSGLGASHRESVAAKGSPSGTVEGALQLLLDCTADALERYQGSILKGQDRLLAEFASGRINEELVIKQPHHLFHHN